MTTFDQITQSPDILATFLTTLVRETEDKMLAKLDEYGIQASIVRVAEEVQDTENLAMLLQEVPDGDTEDT